MENEINFKGKNTSHLWIFLLANIFFLLAVSFPMYFRNLTEELDIFFILKTLGATIAPLLLFLLNGLLSSHQKAILVFWKLKNPLPGSEAFSRLSKSDSRVNLGMLKNTYGNLPKNPKEQNKLWYKIYTKNRFNIIVLNSQQAFLLARDLTSLAVLFIFFLGLPTLILGKWPYSFYYVVGLLLQYLIVAIGAKNRGRRFVTNVLAIESCY